MATLWPGSTNAGMIPEGEVLGAGGCGGNCVGSGQPSSGGLLGRRLIHGWPALIRIPCLRRCLLLRRWLHILGLQGRSLAIVGLQGRPLLAIVGLQGRALLAIVGLQGRALLAILGAPSLGKRRPPLLGGGSHQYSALDPLQHKALHRQAQKAC